MSGPKKSVAVFIPPELHRILKEINAVTENEVETWSQTLRPVERVEEVVRTLDLFARKTATLMLRKGHSSEEAGKAGDIPTADKLEVERSIAADILSFLVNISPLPKTSRKESTTWGIRRGFVLVLWTSKEEEGGEGLEIEFEPEDPEDFFGDEGEEDLPHPPIDKSKLN